MIPVTTVAPLAGLPSGRRTTPSIRRACPAFGCTLDCDASARSSVVRDGRARATPIPPAITAKQSVIVASPTRRRMGAGEIVRLMLSSRSRSMRATTVRRSRNMSGAERE